MRRNQVLVILIGVAMFFTPSLAKKSERPRLPAKIMQASSVYIDCVCPAELTVAREIATEQLKRWGRFEISNDSRGADLVFLFSGNPYLGDYLARNGSDTRKVSLASTILTVVDPSTGQALWSDSRRWGGSRIEAATKDLIDELRKQIEGQTARLSLNDILMCSVTPVYAGFENLTPEEALEDSNSGQRQVLRAADQLLLTSAEAPEFCKRAEFLFSPERRIVGFQVNVSRDDNLDVRDVLEHADRFDFASGKCPSGHEICFTALSKDKKILIEFAVAGSYTTLSRVRYFY